MRRLPHPEVPALALAALLAALVLPPAPAPRGAAAASLPGVHPASVVQWECYQLVVSGCVCGWPPRPCLFLTYWQPHLLINTQEYAGIAPGAQHRFHEARVWPFPLAAIDPAGCLFPCPDPLAGLSLDGMRPLYLSDADPAWRTSVSAGGGGRVGVWGPLRPRVGWAAGSQPVASGLTAYRAADIAVNDGTGHVVLGGLGGRRVSTDDNINLGFPRLSPCLKPGEPPQRWEGGQAGPLGQYVWVYWTRKACCLDPSELCRGRLAAVPAIAEACAAAARGVRPAAAAVAWARP